MSDRNEKGQFLPGNKCAPGGPIGNKFALNLKTPEKRRQVFEHFCQWIAQGNPKNGWFYEDDEVTLSWKSLDNYLRNYPEEFTQEEVEISRSKGLMKWVKEGRQILFQEVKGDVAMYQMFMRNLYKWDRPDKSEEDESDNQSFLKKMASAWRGQ